MNDVVKLTPIKIIHKQHKANNIVGGVTVGNKQRTAVVIGDHDVLKSDRMQHDLQRA